MEQEGQNSPSPFSTAWIQSRERIAKLADDWAGPDTFAPEAESIHLTERTVGKLREQGLPEPGLSADSDGSVELRWAGLTVTLDIELGIWINVSREPDSRAVDFPKKGKSSFAAEEILKVWKTITL
jgi:hypothetical protein